MRLSEIRQLLIEILNSKGGADEGKKINIRRKEDE